MKLSLNVLAALLLGLVALCAVGCGSNESVDTANATPIPEPTPPGGDPRAMPSTTSGNTPPPAAPANGG